jgi:hypothetical protein
MPPPIGDQGMFAGVAKIVNGAEQSVPSVLLGPRFEAANDVLDFEGDIFRSSFHPVLEFHRVAGEGDNAALQPSIARLDVGGSPSGMVKTGPDVLDDFCSKDAPAVGKPLSESDFVYFVNSIRIKIADRSVWLFREESNNMQFERVEVLVCPLDSKLGAVERVDGRGHGQEDIRSDERPGIHAGAGEPIEGPSQASFGNEDQKASTEADAGSESQESKALDDSLPLVTKKSDRDGEGPIAIGAPEKAFGISAAPSRPSEFPSRDRTRPKAAMRSQFLEAVAGKLAVAGELGDGVVSRCCRAPLSHFARFEPHGQMGARSRQADHQSSR